MFVSIDGTFYSNFPSEPKVGDVVILNHEPRRIRSVVIELASGGFICQTERISDSEQGDDDTRAKDVQPAKHRQGKRH
jgi:hypothetical protein